MGTPGPEAHGPPPGEDFTSTLAEEAERVTKDQTPESILERIAAVACAVLPGCSGASITVLEEGRPTTTAATVDWALELDLAQYGADLGPCLAALRSGKVVRSAEADERWSVFRAAARRHGVHTYLSVPLTAGDVTLGSLNLYSKAPEGLTRDGDVEAATLLAEQAVAAASAVQAFEAERTTALVLQRSLLPDRLPPVPGYQLAGRYLPASVSPMSAATGTTPLPAPTGCFRRRRPTPRNRTSGRRR